MLDVSIMSMSHSPFASQLLLLKKKDDTWRFYVDYKELNIIIKDKFPLLSS